MSMSTAAAARAAATRARSDRPTQRHSSGGDARVGGFPITGLQLRDQADTNLIGFAGYASVTGRPYEMYDAFGPYTETVASDAFDKTLLRGDLDVPLVLQHADLRRIARTTNGTLRLSVDGIGLRTEADLDPADPDVAYIVPKMRAGLIDEMSFKFRITRGEWNDSYDHFDILEVDIHRGDVAICGYGANPFTAGAGVRSVVDGWCDTDAREALTALEARFPTQTPAQRHAPDLRTIRF